MTAKVSDCRGSEVLEAALVLPLMFILLLGIFWVGRAYNIYAAMNHAAREGARTAGNPSCATCGNTAPTGDVIATQSVAPALQASGLDPSLVTYTTPYFCPCGVTACASPVACDSAGTGAVPSICVQYNVDMGVPNYSPPVCGTAVSFQYPLKIPMLPWIPYGVADYSNIVLKTQVEARYEQ